MSKYEIININGCGDYECMAEVNDIMAAMVVHYDEMISSKLDSWHCALIENQYSNRINCRIGRRVYYDDEI